jgi:hypothetical protein
MAAEEQVTLPFSSWDEDGVLSARSGARLTRWGSVREASRILWGYQKDSIYKLLRAGVVRAVKRPGRNCSWRVDLLSAWEYKQRVENGDF